MFNDLERWKPMVVWALERAGLDPVAPEALRAGTLGTFPTYLTGTGLVVKLFPPVFDGPRSFTAELAANEALMGSDLPAPRLVATGELLDDPPTLERQRVVSDALALQSGEGREGGAWRWPFLVFEEAPGVPLAVARRSLGDTQLQVLAEDMGEFLRRLHHLRGPTGTWDAYLMVLERRKRQVPDDDFRRHGHLAPHLLDAIPAYLERFPDEVRFDASAAPTFLHADLHHDHLFVDPATGHLRSVIDWGDVLEGDRWYDFGALVAGAFHGDRRLIDACYGAYGERPDPEVQLARMLLHGFDLFDAVPDELRKGSRSLEELALRLG